MIDQAQRPSTDDFRLSYDRCADTLYVSTKADGGSDARIDRFGVVWRYDRSGALVGATVMDFRERWPAERAGLTQRFAKRFALPQEDAEVVLERAFQLDG